MRLRKRGVLRFAAVASAVVLGSSSVYAADTTEVFDPGASDFELYAGYEGIGLPKPERLAVSEALVGYGITDRFSAFAVLGMEGGNALTEGLMGSAVGVFATPMDTNNFDFDLYASVGASSDGGFEVAPGLELNLDSKPDLEGFGFYMRAAVPIYGRTTETTGPNPVTKAERTFHFDVQAGVYATLGDGHQVLLEHDFAILPDPGEEDRDYEVGGIALGYNLPIAENIELINQLTLDIPQDDEEVSVGVMTGFIATLPSGND